MKRLFSEREGAQGRSKAQRPATADGDWPVSLLHSCSPFFSSADLPQGDRPRRRACQADVAVRPPMRETARGKEDRGPRQRPVFCRVGASCERFSHVVDNACMRPRANARNRDTDPTYANAIA